ncbi:hypothetical protein M885DRAFT_623474 [Pelagophyceae sp. CCMP2097]|nr:hypothetical protein M885DRAFT_623474 [Pelagophyceae sp. CCMP2097]
MVNKYRLLSQDPRRPDEVEHLWHLADRNIKGVVDIDDFLLFVDELERAIADGNYPPRRQRMMAWPPPDETAAMPPSTVTAAMQPSTVP